MKIINTFFLVLLLNFKTGIGQETPESLIKSFFNYVAEENYSRAVDYLLNTNNYLKNDTAIFERLTNNLQAAHDRNGAYCGYEDIEKEQVSDSYVIYTYFIKYQMNPVRIQFTFYKPSDKWQVNNVVLIPQEREQKGRNTPKTNANRNNANKTSPAKKSQ